MCLSTHSGRRTLGRSPLRSSRAGVPFRPSRRQEHDEEPRFGRRQVSAEDGTEQRSEEHTSELQSLRHLVCRLLLEKKKKIQHNKLQHVKGAEIECAQINMPDWEL